MTLFWWGAHALMAAVDALALLRITKGESAPDVFTGALWWSIGMLITVWLVLLTASDVDNFMLMALIGFALFMHGPVVLCASAALASGRTRAVLATCGIALGILAIDVYRIEPGWIEVNHVYIVVPDAPRALTVAVLADMQTDGITTHEPRALALALAEHPDIVLFPGDLVQMSERAGYERVRTELNTAFREGGLEAPLGVYAVDGNVDVGRPWVAVFDGIDAHAIEDNIAHFEPSPGVHITALPFHQGFDSKLEIADHPGLHLVFAHGPDFALGDIQADVLVAGHTHGGQVQLPFIGPLITYSQIPRDWASGVTKLDRDRTLVVSRGVGMERGYAPRLRFRCHPEVVILHISPE